jgi:hypothetical protein
MASPCGATIFPASHIEAMVTVRPSRETDPPRSRQVLAVDPIGSGIFRNPLHVVLYYKSVSEEDSGWLWAGWAMESLSRALSEQQPLLAGRLGRGEDGDGDLEIVSNDNGVRLVQAHIATTLASFLELLKENDEAEAQLVSWPDIDEQSLPFSPLFYVQVSKAHISRGGGQKFPTNGDSSSLIRSPFYFIFSGAKLSFQFVGQFYPLFYN